jgi:hypothetical protein
MCVMTRGVFLPIVLIRAMRSEGIAIRRGALEWEAMEMWRGSITPLRGPSCVSYTEFGDVKVAHLSAKTCLHNHTYHPFKKLHNYRRDIEMSPLHKRTSGCKEPLDTEGDPINCN